MAVEKNVKSNYQSDQLTQKQKDEILADVKKLAMLDDYDDYQITVALTLRKWNDFAPNFTNYFE